jgi:MBG domain (YGX type)
VNGDTPSSLGGTFSFSTPATASSPVGNYAITPSSVTSSNYAISFVNGVLSITPAPLTITANNVTRIYGQPNSAFTVSYGGFVNGDTAGSLGGTLSFSTPATASSPVGTYSITPSGLTSTNYAITFVNGSLTVIPAPLSATGVNFQATAGAPFSGTVATFQNADPFGSVNSYTATITWGDGNSSAGTIIDQGSGVFAVTGTNTYADPNGYNVQVRIQHKLGYKTSPTTNGTATVSSLGLSVQTGLAAGIGFWHNGNGQALIDSFNGGPNATGLANWLALTFPNLYGANAGTNNLFGNTNLQVAAFYLTQFSLHGPKVEAEVLATALNVYATTLSLGGTAASAYGFTVSATGLGARSFNVGVDGAAVGVANNTSLNVFEMLKAVNQRAVGGMLYNGNATLRQQTTDLFDAINQAGGI